jgi:hypothetical protein
MNSERFRQCAAPASRAIQELGDGAARPDARDFELADLFVESMQKSRELVLWLRFQVRGIPIAADARSRVAAACWGIAQDHYTGIVALLDEAPPDCSSAFALLRPLFESFVRGSWLDTKATDEQVEQYRMGAEIPGTASLINAVWASPLDAVREFHDRTWADLCDLTDTGEEHCERCTTSGALHPTYALTQLVAGLDMAARLALLSTAHLGALSTANGDSDLATRILCEGKWRLPPKRHGSGSRGSSPHAY